MKFQISGETSPERQQKTIEDISAEEYRQLDRDGKVRLVREFIRRDARKLREAAESSNDALGYLYALDAYASAAIIDDPYSYPDGTIPDEKPDWSGVADVPGFKRSEETERYLEDKMNKILMAHRELAPASIESGEIAISVHSGDPGDPTASVTILAKEYDGEDLRYIHIETGNACTSRAVEAWEREGAATKVTHKVPLAELRGRLTNQEAGGMITFDEEDHSPEEYVMFALAGGFSNIGELLKMKGSMIEKYLAQSGS